MNGNIPFTNPLLEEAVIAAKSVNLKRYYEVNEEPAHKVHKFVNPWRTGKSWIARVARTASGTFIGEGIRLGTFELDDSGRRVKRWLSEGPFRMINDRMRTLHSVPVFVIAAGKNSVLP